MVSHRDAELLRDESRTSAERESLLKPYLPDPTELSRRPSNQRGKKQASRTTTTTTTPATTASTKKKKTPIRTFLKSQLYQLTYTVIHIFFGITVRLIEIYHAIVDRIFAIVYYHHRTPELIQKDVKGLKRIPEHLSVILSLRKEDDTVAVLMDDVAELAAWSACSGIPVLSVYEKTGILKSCIPTLHQAITNKLSSYYGSRLQRPALRLFAPHHPIYDHPEGDEEEEEDNQSSSHPNTLTLLLLSATDGRETFVDLTKTLAEMSQNGKLSPDDITMELVDAEISEITTHAVQSDGGDSAVSVKPEPDLLLVFGPHLQLEGYPPWHIRLTEMFCTGDRSNGIAGSGEAVEYQGFIRGLWHFAGAQMRFGR